MGRMQFESTGFVHRLVGTSNYSVVTSVLPPGFILSEVDGSDWPVRTWLVECRSLAQGNRRFRNEVFEIDTQDQVSVFILIEFSFHGHRLGGFHSTRSSSMPRLGPWSAYVNSVQMQR